MKIFIKRLVNSFLNKHPKIKQWLWFVTLWLSGLLALLIITYLLKILIKLGQ